MTVTRAGATETSSTSFPELSMACAGREMGTPGTTRARSTVTRTRAARSTALCAPDTRTVVGEYVVSTSS